MYTSPAGGPPFGTRGASCADRPWPVKGIAATDTRSASPRRMINLPSVQAPCHMDSLAMGLPARGVHSDERIALALVSLQREQSAESRKPSAILRVHEREVGDLLIRDGTIRPEDHCIHLSRRSVAVGKRPYRMLSSTACRRPHDGNDQEGRGHANSPNDANPFDPPVNPRDQHERIHAGPLMGRHKQSHVVGFSGLQIPSILDDQACAGCLNEARLKRIPTLVQQCKTKRNGPVPIDHLAEIDLVLRPRTVEGEASPRPSVAVGRDGVRSPRAIRRHSSCGFTLIHARNGDQQPEPGEQEH